MLLCAGMSETGPVKPINQDAYLIQRAQTPEGDVLLAVVADGMSGLDQGEVASAAVIRAFNVWFQHDLPLAGESLGLRGAAFAHVLQIQWANLLQEVNLALIARGLRESKSMGTACTAFLVAAGAFYAVQVGDTRLYCIEGQRVQQLTKDQTFAAQEVAAGRMTREQAARHPLCNTLLQCVGASYDLKPVFEQGIFNPHATYLLCSDGFRRSLTAAEMAGSLSVSSLCAQDLGACAGERPGNRLGVSALESLLRGSLEARLEEMMRIIFARGQRDNATAVVAFALPQGSEVLPEGDGALPQGKEERP